jgi:hypothetical protein
MATTGPALDGWKAAVATLGGLLVDLESDLTVTRARTGVLVGASAATWASTDARISAAWTTYRAVNQLVDDAEIDPSRTAQLLATAVPGRSGTPTDPTTAMRAAKADVEEATAVVDRLREAWDGPASRTQAARAAATAASDQTTVRAADALARLVATDPLAVQEPDVAVLEAAAAKSSGRSNAAAAAAARIDLDLVAARAELAKLDAQAQTADGELQHATSRIAGLQPVTIVQDLDALARWLDRIAALAGRDKARAAADLDDWRASAQARGDELAGALAPARTGLKRREEGRGLWTALRAKAAARHLDEQAEVAAALRSAHDLLWAAPCDLDAADAALAALTEALEANR